MPDEPPVNPAGWHLSERGLEAVKEICKVVLALAAVITLWIQANSTDNKVIEVQKQAVENATKLATIEAKVERMPKPVYYGEKK